MTKRQGPVIFSDIEPYAGLKNAVNLGKSEEVLDVVKNANLRGRGGAGFPTGLKWKLVFDTSAEKKFVICNADEGEPGTFKDKVLLSEYVGLVFEGMTIAAFAIGADAGFMYLRAEYKSLLPAIEEVLAKMRSAGALGKNIMGKDGFDFDIEIRLGAGAYVCGEETALIESLEGNRGEPRNRPPFPVNTGFEGYPTTVNNVETFAVIPHILAKGADWFKKIGTEKSSGSKLLSISGDCKEKGVWEVPYGTSLNEILKLTGTSSAKAIQVGGAGGVCVPAKDFERKIAFEDLPTGGSVIVLGKERALMDMVQNFLEFLKEESCGQCSPCREGIPVLLEAIGMIKCGQCTKEYLDDLLSLAQTLQSSSKCGLGQSVPNAFCSVIENFKDEYKLSKTIKKERAFNG